VAFSTCHACMNVRDARGRTSMDRLIAKLPDAAMVMLAFMYSVFG